MIFFFTSWKSNSWHKHAKWPPNSLDTNSNVSSNSYCQKKSWTLEAMPLVNLDKVSKDTYNWGWCKVSFQGVVALGGHFATLCREVDFYEANKFFIINFKKKVQILLHFFKIILIVKRLQIELHSTNLLLGPPICRNKHAITPKCYNF